ncbi:P-loop NTPase family protein [Weissella cibaria]|uniref:hypothetical protein n=1 Tax=Weissella cibaria TaxID=137591 RepID=UPI0016488A0A|nr:hypothetical protein [Weissella cibaria]
MNIESYKKCSSAISLQGREKSVRKSSIRAVTVDVFNEGVDIPKVNQIVMMRPTVSSIIFLQQLGRGLRKIDGKEYVTIIDFIGNYSNNYMSPMAFDKSRSSNKERIRKNIISPAVTGVSTINFEQVARQQILRAVGDAKLDSAARFKDAYNTLKQKLVIKYRCL